MTTLGKFCGAIFSMSLVLLALGLAECAVAWAVLLWLNVIEELRRKK